MSQTNIIPWTTFNCYVKVRYKQYETVSKSKTQTKHWNFSTQEVHKWFKLIETLFLLRFEFFLTKSRHKQLHNYLIDTRPFNEINFYLSAALERTIKNELKMQGLFALKSAAWTLKMLRNNFVWPKNNFEVLFGTYFWFYFYKFTTCCFVYNVFDIATVFIRYLFSNENFMYLVFTSKSASIIKVL